jgi:hypothetical protein
MLTTFHARLMRSPSVVCAASSGFSSLHQILPLLVFCKHFHIREVAPSKLARGPAVLIVPIIWPSWQTVYIRAKSKALSLVSTLEELLGRKSTGSGLENRDYDQRDTLRWPRDSFYPQTLALTSPISSGLSVGIVRSRTEATEFSFLLSP